MRPPLLSDLNDYRTQWNVLSGSKYYILHFSLIIFSCYICILLKYIYSSTYKTNTHRAPNAISYYTASILHHVSNNSWTSKTCCKQQRMRFLWVKINDAICVDVVGGKSIVKFLYHWDESALRILQTKNRHLSFYPIILFQTFLFILQAMLELRKIRWDRSNRFQHQFSRKTFIFSAKQMKNRAIDCKFRFAFIVTL